MKLYATEGIYAKESKTESEPKELTPMERAENSLKNARKAMAVLEPAEPTLNLYEQYRMLQSNNPTAGGQFWRANKTKILACKFDK